MNILGVITARGGSKRVPRKNIKSFLGKPLVAWTIETALKSGIFDRLILSTEDKTIAEVGKQFGAEVPFVRPAELATDTASSLEVVNHVVQWLKNNENYSNSWIVLLEPSSPGRQPFHLQEIAEIIPKIQNKFDSLVAISAMPGHYTPVKSLVMKGDGEVYRQDGEIIRNFTHQNQDIPPFYFINSSIYAFKTQNILEEKPSLWGNRTLGYPMDSKYAMDIDTQEEWEIAELKMRKILSESKNV